MADEDWAPPFRFDTSERDFEMDDGVTISTTMWERERRPVEEPAEGKKPKKIKEGDPEAPPRSWAILVHGLLSDRREFGELGPKLAAQGVGVIAMDMRGHGKSGGARGIVDMHRTVRDIVEIQRQMKTREEQWDHNPQQWAIIGHSLGGLVALQMGDHLHAGDAIVACCPVRSFRAEVGFLKSLGYGLAYRMAGGNGKRPAPEKTLRYEISYSDIFADKSAMEAAKQKGFLQTRIPLANYPEIMDLDGEEIARHAKDSPVFVVVPDQDKAVDPRGMYAIYDAVTAAKDLKVIRGSGHSLFLDGKREEAILSVVDWVVPRLSAFNEVRPGHTKRPE